MPDNSVDPKMLEQLRKLQQKYDVMGQDLSSYLDGLLYSDYLTYWDYIHVDTLLTLQNPKTSFPDENVFILYHQITELYFKLVLHEIDQIAFKNDLDEKFFMERVGRMIRYFQQLAGSFEIMVDGLEREQFLKFRMALLPSSGFQSAQYRVIEIASTKLINLVGNQYRKDLIGSDDLSELLERIYWREGATELASGKKTLTLQQFEAKYMNSFREASVKYRECNLLTLFKEKFEHSSQKEAIVSMLREYDSLVNVHWRMAHMKTAAKYLHREPTDIMATGGTNWQKYLPPRFQRIMFFPDLWTEKEKEDWGKAVFMASA